MNQTQQLLKNLQREIILTLGVTKTKQSESRFDMLFDLANCIASNRKKDCFACNKEGRIWCGELSRWNDISDKELRRKS